VVQGTGVNDVVDLNTGYPSTQPYGVAADETRNLVYVAAVNSHRIAVINGGSDSLLGWAAFHRGFNDPARPVPLRAIAINPDIGPSGDGGHVWSTTSTGDGSEANQVLMIPKGWGGGFHLPLARNIGSNPGEGIAVNRATDRVYVSSNNSITVLQDITDFCLEPFAEDDSFGFDLVVVE
jgi:DNA-binding beta-propeller fold protein YncE